MKWSLVLLLVLVAACDRPCFDQMVEAGYPARCIEIYAIRGGGTACGFDEATCYGEAVGPLMCSSGDGGVGLCDDGGIGEPAEECEATVDEAGNVRSVVWRDLVKGASASLVIDDTASVIYSDDGGGTLYSATVLNAAPGVVELNVIGAPLKGPFKAEVGSGMVRVSAGAQSVSAPCTIKRR